MNKRIKTLREKVLNGYYKQFRADSVMDLDYIMDCSDMSWEQQVCELLKYMVTQEKAIIEDDERIVFTRTSCHPINPIPETIKKSETIGKKTIGYRVHNICADWEMMLEQGIAGRREAARQSQRLYEKQHPSYVFLKYVIESLNTVEELINKYKTKALEKNRIDVYNALQNIINGRPNCFYHALQALRFLHGVLWMSGHNHIGFGRFDQYMWPYLQHDLKKGMLTEEEAEDLLTEFLISINRDKDVYPGIQIGDNGQSLVLGGIKKNGERGENTLTKMVLKAASLLCLTDPKINLRISTATDEDILIMAAQLVQKGLGFPQFSNDDIVISSLVNNGYDLEDARDYVVAACWEFIIPGKGIDVPNINALSFPAETDAAIRKGLSEDLTFQDILSFVKENIHKRVASYIEHKKSIVYWPPAPLFSAFMSDCIEKGVDINNGGAKYCNFGIHGSGSSNASDALAAVKYCIYDNMITTKQEYLKALDKNWANYENLRDIVINQTPKVGNDDSRADCYLKYLFDTFYDACVQQNGVIKKYGKDVNIRAGTGSAMYYLWLVKNIRPHQIEPVIDATADGRLKEDDISANLAPSPGVKVDGPLSCLQSYSIIDYEKVCNGGPITMELMSSTFKSDRGCMQIVNLIKTFLYRGCQQLQLNVISAEQLKKAQKNPEQYKNLVVRVWGWSAYFVDLDQDFQNHIINRTYYM